MLASVIEEKSVIEIMGFHSATIIHLDNLKQVVINSPRFEIIERSVFMYTKASELVQYQDTWARL
jgi:hypothetical protein